MIKQIRVILNIKVCPGNELNARKMYSIFSRNLKLFVFISGDFHVAIPATLAATITC